MASVNSTHLKTETSPTDALTYATGSFTPSANKLVLAFFGWSQTTGGTPTAAGNNLTWVQVGSTVSQSSRFGALFRALGSSPSTGQLTFTITGGTGNAGRAGWSIAEFGNIDTGGSNGSNAVVQSASNSSNSANALTATLAAFTDPINNASYGGTVEDGATAITPGSGFTELGQSNEATEGLSVESEFKSSPDTTVDWSYGATTVVVGIAVEIKLDPTLIIRDDAAYMM